MDQYFVSSGFYFLLVAAIGGILVRPSVNLLELRYAFAIMMVTGYAGQSLLWLASGDRLESVFLIPKLIPVVQGYAAGAMVAFWIGYHTSRWTPFPPEGPGPAPAPISQRYSPLLILLVLAAIPAVLEIVNFGADFVFGESTVERGYYSRIRGEQKPLLEYMRVIGHAPRFPVAMAAGIAWFQSRRRVYWLVPVLISLPLIAYFSRGMFLPFVVFLLGASFYVTTSKRMLYLSIAGVLAVASFVTGMAMRRYAEKTGLGNYAELIENKDLETTPVGSSIHKPMVAVVDSMDVLSTATRAFDTGPRLEAHLWPGYLLMQLPIPSWLLPATAPKLNLTDDMKLQGARFPYSLVTEMYVFFSWGGWFVFILVGFGVGRIDRMINDKGTLHRRPYLVAAIYGLALYFLIRSFHSGLRSSFRPAMYVLGAYAMWQLFKPRAQAGKQLDPVIQRIRALPARRPPK